MHPLFVSYHALLASATNEKYMRVVTIADGKGIDGHRSTRTKWGKT